MLLRARLSSVFLWERWDLWTKVGLEGEALAVTFEFKCIDSEEATRSIV